MANLREKQKAHTRKQLLEESLRLFTDKGYSATTVDDIATAVGTTRVTFYAHFANKVDVVRALFDELNEVLERGPSEERHSTARSLVEAVRVGTFDSLRDWLLVQAQRWPRIRDHITIVIEASAVDPDIRALKDEWYGEVSGDLVEGMTLASRHDPATHRFRAYLAHEALTSAHLKWNREPWDLAGAPQFDVLAAAWVSLLGDSA
ncbi:TetR family transcriptional regulator [Microbacterium gorillae]|uniref:TetR family transcriptional regulator n=1 Tax=Microbacterium gorillae TaxID=1231063 RepID=UPI00058BF28A|nr:TetR family transcriptional regulator [Microbacterium gorillae]